ncbi:MAG: glycosyltransferase family 9 protein, partial [Elusimicrobia bacterium]|nr:glycosyltransferase family 9 protein [Elusimicrobiota bacterium]
MSAETPRKILLVQLYRIGDALLTTPAARALKAAFPQARVEFLCEQPAYQIVNACPDVDEAVFYDRHHTAAMFWEIRRRRYDWVVDFLGTPRTAVLTALSGAPVRAGSDRVFHRWAYNRKLKHPAEPHYVGLEKILMLESLGVRAAQDPLPRLAIAQDSLDFAKRFYAGAGITPSDPVVTVSPLSRRHFNRWFLDRYAGLCDFLRERFKAKVVVLWGPGERQEAQRVAERANIPPLLGPETR